MRISTFCSGCRKGRLIKDHESGEVVCSNCSMVLSDKAIDRCAEWRNIDYETTYDSTRVGGSPSSIDPHNMVPYTSIGKSEKRL